MFKRSRWLALGVLIAIAGAVVGATGSKFIQLVSIEVMPWPPFNSDTGADQVNIHGDCRVFTADGVIAADAGKLVSVYATGLTANDDVLIYDNASAASGTVIFNGLNLPAGKSDFANFPATFANGAYADVTLTSGNINVCYAN